MVLYWTILVALIVVLNVSATVMKVRVNEVLPEKEWFSWWNRNTRGVSRKYREIFPDSYLPDIERYSFGLFVAMVLLLVARSVLGPS